jgi:hemerythrin
MAAIEWQTAFETGLVAIDSQHRRLVDMINRLDALSSSDDTDNYDTVGEILSSLTAYTHYHFEEEEALMEEYQYSELDSHVTAHASLKADLASYVRRWKEREGITPEELLSYLADWLLSHILSVDKKLGSLQPQKAGAF